MAIEEERRKVLELIENGTVSADDGLHLLDVLNETEEEADPQTDDLPQSSSAIPAPVINAHRWKQLWQIPLWLGIILVVAGAIAMAQAVRLNGFGLWFVLSWLPLAAGVLWIIFAWECRSAHWLYLHIRQKAEKKFGNFSFGFPLPLRLTGWLLRVFGDKIPAEQNKTITLLFQALETQTSMDNPIIIDIDDNDDGEQVQLVLG